MYICTCMYIHKYTYVYTYILTWRWRSRCSRMAETNEEKRRSLKGGFAISFNSSPMSAAT